jgi:GLPGLI family protein|tara:strand:+ start:538 stop:1311 length:774 start_codon:yes stop_codon:yes gene_type:complete
MIKQKTSFIILFLLSLNILSQNNFKAEYKLILEKNSYAPIYYELLNKNAKSVFKFIKKTIPDEIVNNQETGEVILNTKTPDSIQSLIITDYKLKKIFVKNYITENNGNSYKLYNTFEPISIEWNYINETKKIDKYLCKKATTKFRGRLYVAWYSEEIPIIVGPWKFHGLPGAIIEISDSSGQVSFNLEKIEIPYDTDIKYDKNNFKNLISIEHFLKIKKTAKVESRKVFKMKILSKLPRGSNIELTKEGNNDIETEI